MGLRVSFADPVRDPAPPGWDAAVDDLRVMSRWSWSVLRTLAWSAQCPTVTALVSTVDGDPVALFHFRLLGPPTNPRRFVGGRAWTALADCRLHPSGSVPGHVFLTEDPGTRQAAVEVVKRRLRRVFAVAFREIPSPSLETFRRPGALLRAGNPTMVIHNRWRSVPDYQASLDRPKRAELRRVAGAIDGDPDIRLAVEDSLSGTEASRLLYQVNRRHRPRWWVFPPVPAAYFDLLAGCGDASFLTYRDGHGALLAFALVHDDGTDLLLSVFGRADTAEGGRDGLYPDVFHRLVSRMVTTGRRRLVLGKGVRVVKERFGAVAEPQFLVLTR